VDVLTGLRETFASQEEFGFMKLEVVFQCGDDDDDSFALQKLILTF
jgi:hypothetical protein